MLIYFKGKALQSLLLKTAPAVRANHTQKRISQGTLISAYLVMNSGTSAVVARCERSGLYSTGQTY